MCTSCFSVQTSSLVFYTIIPVVISIATFVYLTMLLLCFIFLSASLCMTSKSHTHTLVSFYVCLYLPIYKFFSNSVSRSLSFSLPLLYSSFNSRVCFLQHLSPHVNFKNQSYPCNLSLATRHTPSQPAGRVRCTRTPTSSGRTNNDDNDNEKKKQLLQFLNSKLLSEIKIRD